MGYIGIVLPGLPPPDPDTRMGVVISHPAFGDVVLTLTNPELEKSDLAADWTELGRAGLEPMLVRRGWRLPSMRLEATLDETTEINRYNLTGAVDDSGRVVEQKLAALEAMAKLEGPPVSVAYSTLEGGLWRITEFSWKSTKRYPDNHVIRADCTFTFKRAADPPTIVRAPAAPPPAPAVPPPAAPASPGAPPAKKVTVARGDTLWAIAQRSYGNGNLWRKIADANGVRDPRKLRVGQVLTLP